MVAFRKEGCEIGGGGWAKAQRWHESGVCRLNDDKCGTEGGGFREVSFTALAPPPAFPDGLLAPLGERPRALLPALGGSCGCEGCLLPPGS